MTEQHRYVLQNIETAAGAQWIGAGGAREGGVEHSGILGRHEVYRVGRRS